MNATPLPGGHGVEWPPPGLGTEGAAVGGDWAPHPADGPADWQAAPAPTAAAPLPPPRPAPAARRGRGGPGPARIRLAAEGIAGNLVIGRDHITAWYVLPLQQWTFRPAGERTALVEALATRLSQFAGRRIYLRVTSRPYEAAQWAAELDASIRGRHPVLPGPCPAHPHLSVAGCPSCRPGHGWLDWLAAQQARIQQWGIADRVVHLGVQVAGRRGLTRLLGRAWARAADVEISGLEAAAAGISAVAAGPGLRGAPATPAQLRWLFTRSLGLHLPAPAAAEQDPAPAPFALPSAAPGVIDAAELGGIAAAFRWTARPFGRTVLVTRSDGAAAHVAVLTVAGMTDQDDTDPSPWIQRTDRLGFPVEWMITADVRRREDVAREMRHLINRIRHQADHVTVEHGQPAPPALARQMQRAQQIEDASQRGPQAFASRVCAWARIAVAGETEQQALQRAAQVVELYSPGITIVHAPGQHALAQEMIPGQPHADYGHRRSLETAALAAGMPAASAVVGHRHGFPIGVTTRTAARAVTVHPWHATETLNHSALIAVLGAPGAGKSTLAGLLIYMAARAGIRSVVMDPSGLLDRLCALPELAAASVAANLLDGEPGILCPYRLIPDPAPGTPRLEQQLRAAAVARRALVADILRMLLPVRVHGEATEFALAEAVRKAPSTVSSSPQQVIAALRSLDRESLADRGALLAGILSDLSEHPLARLFFPAGDAADSAAAGRGRVLTVMTLRGLVLPGAARRPEERTVEEQLSIPIVHLAAQLLRRLLLDLPREDRKLAVLDEAHMITGDPAGRKAVNELARDGRKTNTCVTVISHNAADLLAAGLAGLIGAVFAFRTEHPHEQAATLDLLGLPRGAGHEQLLGELSREARAGSGATGECLLRDGDGGIEQVQVDLGGHLGLRAALDSTPGRRRARAAAGPARRPRPVAVAR